MKALAWQLLESLEHYRARIFTLRRDRARSPLSGREHDFDIVDAPDWVNVVALTPERQVLLIRQYRHGTRQITLEIPGGAVDPGETPLEAAKRELYEETGYRAPHWRPLGVVEPNPAFQPNATHTFLAMEARKEGDGAPDDNEEIEVEERSLDQVCQLLCKGAIKHSLVLCAFFHLILQGSEKDLCRQLGGPLALP